MTASQDFALLCVSLSVCLSACLPVSVRVCVVCVSVYVWPGANWGSSPPSFNIKRYLVFSGETNSQKLFLFHLVVLESLWNFRFHNLSPRALDSSPVDY